MSNVPCRNPLKYCRLCLCQKNELVVMTSPDHLTTTDKLLLQKMYHYMKISFHKDQDYPFAICVTCTNRFDSFHYFRRTVVRNHNAVKTYRRLFPDEFDIPAEPDDEGATIELIDDDEVLDIKQEEEDSGEYYDDPQQVEIKQENEDNGGSMDDSYPVQIKQEIEVEDFRIGGLKINPAKPAKEIVKEVDVYHLDGELRSVVVKEESLLPIKSPPVTPATQKNQQLNKSPAAPQTKPNVINSKISIIKRPQGKLLNTEHSEKRLKTVAETDCIKLPQGKLLNTENTEKPLKTIAETDFTKQSPQGKLLNTEHSDKRPKRIAETAFSVVKCSHCRAVFRNRENLIIHEQHDHPNKILLAKPATTTTITSPKKPSRPLPQSPPQKVTLHKCSHCSSSFIQYPNYTQHMKTCRAAALSKLNPQIVVKRTTPAAMNEVLKAAVAKIGKQVQIKPVVESKQQQEQEPFADKRIRCPYCPLTYKTKYFLKKHMLDVHKIDDYENVFYCHVCKLNYSCNEDLQLHNRAIHRFQCTQCLDDFRTCMHAQTSNGGLGQNGFNKAFNIEGQSFGKIKIIDWDDWHQTGKQKQLLKIV